MCQGTLLRGGRTQLCDSAQLHGKDRFITGTGQYTEDQTIQVKVSKKREAKGKDKKQAGFKIQAGYDYDHDYEEGWKVSKEHEQTGNETSIHKIKQE